MTIIAIVFIAVNVSTAVTAAFAATLLPPITMDVLALSRAKWMRINTAINVYNNSSIHVFGVTS